MIQKGDRVLELRDERGSSLVLPLQELDALIAALQLLQRSEAQGLRLRRLEGSTWIVSTWTAGE